MLQCRLMLLQQLKIKLVQVFLAAKGKKLGVGIVHYEVITLKLSSAKLLLLFFGGGLANAIRLHCFLLC